MQSELTNFLKKENLMLKQENKELKNLLDLNRTALKISTQFKKGEANYPALVNLLYQENSKLHHKIKELSTELETGMCKALISEQIAFASTEQERYLTYDLKDKLTKMRKELQNRDRKIIQLMKHEAQKKGGQGNDSKIIEFTEMSLISKKFKDNINDLQNELENKEQELFKYKDQKQELLKLNLILTKQINELKIISSQQSTGSNDKGDLSKFMNYQKKIIQDEDDPESDMEHYQDSDSERSSSVSQTFEEPSKVVSKVSKLEISKVPKLELAKAKQIQQLIVQKINNDENKKKGVVKEEKFKKIEIEMSALRKKIGSLMLQKIEVEKENTFLKRFVKELQFRNEALCNSRNQTVDLNQTISMMNQYNRPQQFSNTETLLDMCRDITLNPVLKKVIDGSIELPFIEGICSYDI